MFPDSSLKKLLDSSDALADDNFSVNISSSLTAVEWEIKLLPCILSTIL
uniref:Uncharacterized protein n=1 Tax=Rhizophora mucronata TaxID=61149 RepID=A0A2P2IRD0_RHIMU